MAWAGPALSHSPPHAPPRSGIHKVRPCGLLRMGSASAMLGPPAGLPEAAGQPWHRPQTSSGQVQPLWGEDPCITELLGHGWTPEASRQLSSAIPQHLATSLHTQTLCPWPGEDSLSPAPPIMLSPLLQPMVPGALKGGERWAWPPTRKQVQGDQQGTAVGTPHAQTHTLTSQGKRTGLGCHGEVGWRRAQQYVVGSQCKPGSKSPHPHPRRRWDRPPVARLWEV